MSSGRTFFAGLVVLGLAACGGPKVATTGPGRVDLPVSDGQGKGKKPGLYSMLDVLGLSDV